MPKYHPTRAALIMVNDVRPRYETLPMRQSGIRVQRSAVPHHRFHSQLRITKIHIFELTTHTSLTQRSQQISTLQRSPTSEQTAQ